MSTTTTTTSPSTTTVIPAAPMPPVAPGRAGGRGRVWATVALTAVSFYGAISAPIQASQDVSQVRDAGSVVVEVEAAGGAAEVVSGN